MGFIGASYSLFWPSRELEPNFALAPLGYRTSGILSSRLLMVFGVGFHQETTIFRDGLYDSGHLAPSDPRSLQFSWLCMTTKLSQPASRGRREVLAMGPNPRAFVGQPSLAWRILPEGDLGDNVLDDRRAPCFFRRRLFLSGSEVECFWPVRLGRWRHRADDFAADFRRTNIY